MCLKCLKKKSCCFSLGSCMLIWGGAKVIVSVLTASAVIASVPSSEISLSVLDWILVALGVYCCPDAVFSTITVLGVYWIKPKLLKVGYIYMLLSLIYIVILAVIFFIVGINKLQEGFAREPIIAQLKLVGTIFCLCVLLQIYLILTIPKLQKRIAQGEYDVPEDVAEKAEEEEEL